MENVERVVIEIPATVAEILAHGIAETLEQFAEELRDNQDSETTRRISGELADYARGYMRMAAERMARAEYYECPICESDFHTERERNGRECREMAAN
jgi:hypothetical protein